MSRTVTEALLDKIDQQDKEIERLRADIPEAIEAAVERVETFNRANWAALQEAQRQIERLKAALRKICSTEKRLTNHGYEIARQALESDDE
jgi:predicted  nucleic acid-binding Zn-ribbon protein